MKEAIDSCNSNQEGEICSGVGKIYGQVQCLEIAKEMNTDSLLSKVNSDLKELYIIFDIYGENIDEENMEPINVKFSFTQLPSPMNVRIDGYSPDITIAQIEPDAKLLSLKATAATIEVVEKPLTIPRLVLISSKISEKSQDINAGEFYVDYMGNLLQNNNYNHINPNIHGVLLSITPEFSEDGESEVRVVLTDTEWHVCTKFPYDSDFCESEIIKIPYDRFTKNGNPIPLTVVAVTHHFDIHSESSKVNQNGIINLTLVDPDYELNKFIIGLESKLLADDKFDVLITSSGDWNSLSSYNAYFTAYQDLISLHTNVLPKIKITQNNVFGYDGQISPPIIDGGDASGDESNGEVVDPPTEGGGDDDNSNSNFQTILKFNNVAYIMVYQENFEITTEQMIEACNMNPNIMGCDIFLGGNFQIAKPSTLKDCISSIKTNSDFLMIIFNEEAELDLSKLNNPIPVFLVGPDSESAIRHSKTVKNLINKDKFYQKLFSNTQKITKSLKGLEMRNKKIKSLFNRRQIVPKALKTITISGNTKYNAPTICFFIVDIKIIDSPLKVENLGVYMSTLDANSQALQPKNLLVDESSHQYLSEHSELIKAKQYGLMGGIYNPKEDYGYQISFKKDSWQISSFLNKEHANTISLAEIPYGFCEELVFAQASHYYELNADSNSVSTIKPVNITVIDIITHLNFYEMFPGMDEAKLLENDKFTIRLASTGNWGSLSGTMHLSCYKDYIDLKTETNPNIVFETIDLKPNDEGGSPAEPTSGTTIPPSTENTTEPSIEDPTLKDTHLMGSVELSNNKVENKNNIEKLFNSSKIDQYVQVSSNNNEFEFENLELNDGQYINVPIKSDITLNNGSLNLYINEPSNNNNGFSINIKETKDIKLALKNNESAYVQINSLSDESGNNKDVTIASQSEVYAPLNIRVGNNIQTLTIDSINLHTSGSVSVEKSTEKSVNIKKLEAQPQTKGKLYNIKITNEMSVSQSSSITLDDTIIDQSAVINVKLDSYNIKNYKEPLITGVLKDPPNIITLQKSGNHDGSPNSDNYVIFSGTFENGCEAWKNNLILDGTEFDHKECINPDGNSKILASEKKSLIVSKRNVGNPPDKSNNGLPKAAIIGIVVGCIVVVAIVVVVVVIVVIKKRKKDNESSEKEQVDL